MTVASDKMPDWWPLAAKPRNPVKINYPGANAIWCGASATPTYSLGSRTIPLKSVRGGHTTFNESKALNLNISVKSRY